MPQVLATIELHRVVATGTEQPEEIAANMPEQLQVQDAVLGMVLMRADLNQLRSSSERLRCLSDRGLPWAAAH